MINVLQQIVANGLAHVPWDRLTSDQYFPHSARPVSTGDGPSFGSATSKAHGTPPGPTSDTSPRNGGGPRLLTSNNSEDSKSTRKRGSCFKCWITRERCAVEGTSEPDGVRTQIIDYVEHLLEKAGMSFPDCTGKRCQLARVFGRRWMALARVARGGVGLRRTPDPTSSTDNASLKAGSDSGYASSLAVSKMTDTGHSEDWGLGSGYHLGQRSPEPVDHLGRPPRPQTHPFTKDVDIDPRAYPSGFSQAHEASPSTSSGVDRSPAMSLDSYAVSDGEMSFAMSVDSDDLLEHWEANLDSKLSRIRSHLVQRLVDTYTIADSEVHAATEGTATAEPTSSHGSSDHTSSSLSRRTQTSDTSLGKHKNSEEDEDDDLQDRDRPSRRKRTRVTTESISLDGRLLACPYCKYDPIRFSEHNIDEKHYRGCSSSYLSTISRLKQHLYRVHRRPEFYCRSCFHVFQSEDQLDIHTRTRPSCEPCEPKFAEKMTVEQMASVKRRKPGKTPSDTWFAIFRILFPEAPLPESPYADSVSADAIRAFMDHFHRRAQAILSALIREQLGNTLVLHSDQQRILDTALESAIAGLVWRIGPSGQEAEQQQTAPNSTETGMQAAFEGDMDVPLAGDELADPQMPQTSDLPLTDIANWTSSWGFEGFQDFGDIESIFR